MPKKFVAVFFQPNQRELSGFRSALKLQGGKISYEKRFSNKKVTQVFFETSRGSRAPVLMPKLFGENKKKNKIILTQEVFFSKKRLCVFDMDSTLINQEVIDEIAALIGIKNEVAEITERAMQGELTFNESLKARCALLMGIRESELSHVLKNITLTPGAPSLFRVLRKNKITTALVSGGFVFAVKKIARELSIDFFFANEFVIKDGRLTGRVKSPIVNAAYKKRTVLALQKRLGLSREQTLACGDGANDILMVKASGIGIAFCAKEKLKREAALCLDVRDLSVIEYLFG